MKLKNVKNNPVRKDPFARNPDYLLYPCNSLRANGKEISAEKL